jgi:hypothetical protein
MAKTEDCDRCQMFSGYCGTKFLVCAVHPSGPSETPCPDFAEVMGQWEPLGSAHYDGRLVPQPEHYLTTAERLEILETHPLFTGVCPDCGGAIASHPESAGEGLFHHDCDRCRWKDESVA